MLFIIKKYKEADELNKIIPNKANARQAAFAGVGQEEAEIAMTAGRITSLIADFTPIGGIKGVAELLLKKDLVTHEEFEFEELSSMKIGAVKSILNIGTSKFTSNNVEVKKPQMQDTVQSMEIEGFGTITARVIEEVDDVPTGKVKEASGSGKGIGNLDTSNSIKNYTYENGKYEDASYHNSNQGNDLKSKAPADGQKALDSSIQIKDTSPRRIAIVGDEIVILDRTIDGIYHGHVRTWTELLKEGKKSQEIRNTLIKNRLVDTKGRIIKK